MTKTPPPTQNYKNAVVRIYQGSKVIGAGFLVEGGSVLTCAHVVRDALSLPPNSSPPIGKSLKVNFPYLGLSQKLSAQVVFYELMKGDDQPNVDIAALQLLDPLPPEAMPVPLALNYQLHQPYYVVGFPEGHPKGISSFGQLLTDLPHGWVQMEDTKAQGLAILPGFSGAPVWNEAEVAVVGMVVARDKNEPTAKIGFMIPARSLLKVKKELEFLSLLNLLQPQAEALKTSIHRAYSLVAPEGWSELPPETLEATLTNLQEMPQGDEAYPAIARFTALLCSPGLNPDEDLRRQLEAWLGQHRFDTQALLQSVQSLLTPEPQAAETARESHLLIYVKDDAGDEKSVLALFVPNAEHYDSRTGSVCDRLQAPGLGSFNEKVTLQTLPKLVRACIKEVTPKAQNLLVHLILPLAWVNQACDRWPLIEQAALPAILAQALPPELKMGAQYRLVVRISERLNAEIRNYFEEDWRKKWFALHQLQPSQVRAAFTPGDGLCFQTELVAKLKQPQTLGLKLLTVCDELRSQHFLGALIAAGTPAALWLRQEQFCESLVAADEIDTILTGRIAMLPEAVRQCRSDAMGAANDAHIGHHLAFLWEDPNLVPPSTDPRSTIGMPKAS